MRTRLFMPEDMDEVLRLAEMQVAENHPHLEFRRDMAQQELTRSLETAHPTIFVAEDAGEVVGYIACSLNEYTFTSGVFVSQEVIYVRPDKRGTRAAVRLIKEFLRWGEVVGAREWTFGVSNGFHPERTAKLFEHFGAERVGVYLKKVRA